MANSNTVAVAIQRQDNGPEPEQLVAPSQREEVTNDGDHDEARRGSGAT